MQSMVDLYPSMNRVCVEVIINPHSIINQNTMNGIMTVIEQVLFKAVSSQQRGMNLFQFRGPFWNEKEELFTMMFHVNLFPGNNPFESIEKLIDLLVKKLEFKLKFSFDRIIQVSK